MLTFVPGMICAETRASDDANKTPMKRRVQIVGRVDANAEVLIADPASLSRTSLRRTRVPFFRARVL
jgi:hypothetical protein